MHRKEQRELALLRMDLRSLARSPMVREQPELQAVVGRIAERVERLPAAAGLSVAQTAEHLGVSQPTVRSWLRKGVLEEVAGISPVEVTLESCERAHRILGELAERGQDRDWLAALSDYLRAADAPPEVLRLETLDPDEYDIV